MKSCFTFRLKVPKKNKVTEADAPSEEPPKTYLDGLKRLFRARIKIEKMKRLSPKAKKKMKVDLKNKLHELDKQFMNAKDIDILSVSKLKRIVLDLGILVDGSGSMYAFDVKHNYNRWLYVVDSIKSLFEKHMHSPVHIFGEDTKKDSRNGYDGEGHTVKSFVTSKRMTQPEFPASGKDTGTSPLSIIFAMKQMGFDSGNKALLIFSDGKFDTPFADVIKKALEEEGLGGLQKIILVFPPGVKSEIIQEVQLSVSTVLEQVTDRMIHLAVIDVGNINRELSFVDVPKGYILLGTRRGGICVPKDASAKEIAQKIRSTPDLVKHMWNMIILMVKTIDTNPRIILGESGQYAKLHAVLGHLKDLDIPVKKKGQKDPIEMTVQQAYFDMLSKMDDPHGILSDLRQKAQLEGSSNKDDLMVAIMSACRLFVKPGNKTLANNMMEKIGGAIRDGSNLSFLQLIHDVFEDGQTKVHLRNDHVVLGGDDGGMPFPDRDMFENDESYTKALLKCWQRFFLCFGKEFRQNLSKSKVFALLLVLYGDPEIEIPEEMMKPITDLLFNEKFLVESLGLKDTKEGLVLDLPDVFFTPWFAELLDNVLRSPDCPKSELLDDLRSYVQGVHWTFKLRQAYKDLTGYVNRLKSEYPVPKEPETLAEKKRTVYLLHTKKIGIWRDPQGQLSSCLLGGALVSNQISIANIGKRSSYLYCDNPSDNDSFLRFLTVARTVFEKQLKVNFHGKELEMMVDAVMDKFTETLHTPLGTDTACIASNYLERLGTLKENDFQNYKVQLDTLFATWRAQDFRKVYTKEEKVNLRKARDQMIKDLVDEFAREMTIKTRSPSKDEARKLIHALFPFFDLFVSKDKKWENAWPTKRHHIEWILKELVEDNLVMRNLKAKNLQPNHDVFVLEAENKEHVSLFSMVDDIVAELHKLMAPNPCKRSFTHKICVVCFEQTSRDGRVPSPCGHAVCKDCQTFMAKEVVQSLEPGNNIPMSLCVCPGCRGNYILPDWEELAGVRQFFESGKKREPKAFYRQCEEWNCPNVFVAGYANCAGEPGGIQSKCEKHRKQLFFKCPNCGMAQQHGSGCHLVRCCGVGYHCPAEEGYYCSHCVCGDSKCRNVDHPKGCGHTWRINNKLAERGND